MMMIMVDHNWWLMIDDNSLLTIDDDHDHHHHKCSKHTQIYVHHLKNNAEKYPKCMHCHKKLHSRYDSQIYTAQLNAWAKTQ